jgi:7-cyano-7-deazaguanine synthase in queuosine biosynthesis
MKILMFSGGLDSTYMCWKMLNENVKMIHIHYVSIRNDSEGIWKKEDIATERIIQYFRDHNLEFKYSTSVFEFFGHVQCGFDSDLLLVVAQKLALNSYGKNIEVFLGWNPYDIKRQIIIDRTNRQVTQNIWKSLVESIDNRNNVSKSLRFPLIEHNITKDIIMKKMPQELIDLTWSCRRGGDSPCGRCNSCVELKSSLNISS